VENVLTISITVFDLYIIVGMIFWFFLGWIGYRAARHNGMRRSMGAAFFFMILGLFGLVFGAFA